MSRPIEDYAIVGDGETCALIARDGSVDWLCWPRFDSPACFAALLGTRDHGHWSLAPSSECTSTRRYHENTLILETTFTTPEGEVTITDFMPARTDCSHLVRTVQGVRGNVPMCMELVIRMDYGSILPWVTQQRADKDGHELNELSAIAGPDRLTLRTPIAMHGENNRTVAAFTVKAGESAKFVLTWSASHVPVPVMIDVDESLAKTETFWRDWAGKCQYHGSRWWDPVVRSLITLKSLIYHPTGGIVAAPTTSLPERIGGARNWDYRYCWLRDATFTLLALMDAGYIDEARRWRDWLVRALAGAPEQAQIMYGIRGERRLTEWEVGWLPGYAGSKPVRIGNAAYLQLQLDVYGEIADALHHGRLGGIDSMDAAWAVQRTLTQHLEKIWTSKDEGIWEVRGPRRHFTHSKMMAWVAVDRAILAAERYGLPGPVERWRTLRARIHRDVCTHGYDEKRKTFTQWYGSKALDASLLMMPLVGFLPPQDPRVRGTVEAIGRELMQDGFILRYHTAQTDDGLEGHEGAFLPCSFWYADNLALLGRHDEAVEIFERLLACRNDVGLLAEEYDPRARRQLGNFPQAFSHVALVASAYNLERAEATKPAEQRAAQAR